MLPTTWISTKKTKQSIKIIEKISQTLQIDFVIASLLFQLGIDNIAAAKMFLKPKLCELKDPFLIQDLQFVVNRLWKAFQNQDSIIIIGDYDVDGITSTTLLMFVLRFFNLNVEYSIPKRLQEGYGLSQSILNRLLIRKKPDLIIALDCGTNSKKEIKFLKNLGIDVIVIDHHFSKEKQLPKNCIFLNPHLQKNQNSSWKNFCTVGLVFKVVHGFVKYLRKKRILKAFTIDLKDYLYLVAMGNIADMVPLKQENRILTYHGLQRISYSKHPGICAFLKSTGIASKQKIKSSDIAFLLSPRINASGRLHDASLSIKMLLEKDHNSCTSIANKLNIFNKKRRLIENAIFQEAKNKVNLEQKNAAAIILYNKNWHSGVVGIVAGRLTKLYNRPSIVFGNAKNSFTKGSGRSITGISLIDTLKKCEILLKNWGGHSMAVGVEIDIKKINDFQCTFNKIVKGIRNKQNTLKNIKISAWLKLNDIKNSLLDDLYQLEPFGEENKEPIFGIRKIQIKKEPELFGDGHYKFNLKLNTKKLLKIIAWKYCESIIPCHQALDIIIKINWNNWNNYKFPQGELIDWRLSKF